MAARNQSPKRRDGGRGSDERRPVPSSSTRAPAARAAIVLIAVAALVGLATIGLSSHGPGSSAAPSGVASGGPPASYLGGPTGQPSPSAEASTGPSVGVASPSIAALTPPGGHDRGYLVTLDELRDTVDRAKLGHEPERTAVTDLMAWAPGALAVPASPSEPLRITDTEAPFVDDTARAYGLALAYGVSGDLRYAEAARAIVDAWVTTTHTTKDTCPQDGACETSLVIGRAAPGFVFAVDLIADSRAWSTGDDAAFRTWLRDIILPTASLRDNNWGDAGLLLRASATDWLGDDAGFSAAMTDWRRRIDLIEPDGSIPEETRRGTAGMMYTQEALLYKVAVARIAERRGVDLWSSIGAKGGSLKLAVDLLADYWAHPEDWPYQVDVSPPDPGPMWEIAYQHWGEAAYARIIEGTRPFGAEGHSAVRWTTLTNGVPITS